MAEEQGWHWGAWAGWWSRWAPAAGGRGWAGGWAHRAEAEEGPRGIPWTLRPGATLPPAPAGVQVRGDEPAADVAADSTEALDMVCLVSLWPVSRAGYPAVGEQHSWRECEEFCAAAGCRVTLRGQGRGARRRPNLLVVKGHDGEVRAVFKELYQAAAAVGLPVHKVPIIHAHACQISLRLLLGALLCTCVRHVYNACACSGPSGSTCCDPPPHWRSCSPCTACRCCWASASCGAAGG